ncbi:hypothetical protein HDV57DRAFT_2124 [Trichoderma longibrachiatum]|uniref:Uncharacterized protein n=1 Tax=Trichoderma longibrachiatum ATCC 18648 TaxID=983965 RepID=A0A2T4CK49_TRILO|nr:hypothetical protein M440DRAFT_1026182 [Trichoderma longibrachiatum ATCC 18648]
MVFLHKAVASIQGSLYNHPAEFPAFLPLSNCMFLPNWLSTKTHRVSTSYDSITLHRGHPIIDSISSVSTCQPRPIRIQQPLRITSSCLSSKVIHHIPWLFCHAPLVSSDPCHQPIHRQQPSLHLAVVTLILEQTRARGEGDSQVESIKDKSG